MSVADGTRWARDLPWKRCEDPAVPDAHRPHRWAPAGERLLGQRPADGEWLYCDGNARPGATHPRPDSDVEDLARVCQHAAVVAQEEGRTHATVPAWMLGRVAHAVLDATAGGEA